MDAKDRLIVALDVADAAAAERLVGDLDGVAKFFKIGLALQLAPGIDLLIRELIAGGRQVFLDYKYYDIPETVKKAVSRAAQTGVSFLTIHGSSKLIRAAVEARGTSEMKLFTVTVLTSMEAVDIAEMGYAQCSVEELVLRRAAVALEAGCDGVIASGQEAAKIKQVTRGKLLVTTPGIRPQGSSQDDQKRITTPRQAIGEGTDYLVVGRPITQPERLTPRAAAERIVAEMQEAFDSLAVNP
ncbi:MAG: orotidine-5'-phosphate decarboxylase [Bryobacteraceae bacterium]